MLKEFKLYSCFNVILDNFICHLLYLKSSSGLFVFKLHINVRVKTVVHQVLLSDIFLNKHISIMYNCIIINLNIQFTLLSLNTNGQF